VVIYFRPWTRRRIIVVLALVLVLLGARVGISLQGPKQEVVAKISPVSRVNTSQPSVGIMVDVAQARPEQVRAALTTLEALKVKGTWFLDATTVEAEPSVTKEIASKGHEIGLKGTDQKPLDRLSQVDVKDRLLRARQALAKVGVEPVPFVYPPLGRYSDTVVTAAFQEGCQAVKPAIDASTLRGKEDAAAEKMVGLLKPGDLVILRVGRTGLDPEQRYLESLVRSLEQHGLSPVPLSALVKGIK
jgi:hypothetical protein